MRLEDIKAKAADGVEKQDVPSIASHLLLYISTAMGREVDPSLPWYEVVGLSDALQSLNRPTVDPPLLSSASRGKEPPWDYEGRTFYIWADLLASNYSWSMFDITYMDIDDAVCLLQEILVREQQEREFLWSTSEIAYPYNKNTKKSEFRPLPRPDWMRPTLAHVAGKIKRVKLPKAMLPVGNVVDPPNLEEIVERVTTPADR